MIDWRSWLNSKETRLVLKKIEEQIDELVQTATDGTLLIERSTDKISLDYTLAVGQIEGMRAVIDLIEEEPEEDDQ